MWPICIAAETIVPSGSAVVLGLLPGAVGAVVVGADWMEPMQTAVGAHVTDLLHVGLPAHAIATNLPINWPNTATRSGSTSSS